MAQFGGDTTIGAHIKLLMCDCFDTLVELSTDRYHARKGVRAFLEHYTHTVRLPVVVVSDARADHVAGALEQAGLSDFIERIFHADNGGIEDRDGVLYKRLDRVVTAYKLHPSEVMFIGDSRLDAAAAQEYHVNFIRVPGSLDRDFTFARLVGGASRYRSAEYSSEMLRQFMQDREQND